MAEVSHEQYLREKVGQLEQRIAELQQYRADSTAGTHGEVANGTDARRGDAAGNEVGSAVLEHLVAVTSAVIGDRFFDTLAEHLAKAFGVRCAFVNELVGERADRLNPLASWIDGQPGDAQAYDLHHTPCQFVIERGEFFCGAGVAEQFPDDHMLVELGVTSYCGVRFSGQDGKPLGNICILDSNPLPDSPQLRTLLHLFGQRAAQELQRKQAEDEQKTHNEVLEQIVHSKPLTQILETIVQAIERQMPGARASVLLLEDKQLRHGAAPSLPDEYNGLIDGLEIGPAVGSCGAAAYEKRSVVVSDVLVDDKWTAFLDVVSRFGIRACWSQPILTDGGKVLGTFALYYSEPRSPSEEDLSTVSSFASLACLAIERKRTDEALKLRDLELAHVSRLAMLGEVVAELAHEINQPLYTITNFARACINETTKPEGFSQETLQSWLGQIQDACNRASDILRSTTEFVRRDDQDRVMLDVAEVVHQSVELISWRASRDKIEIAVEPPSQPVQCLGNRVQLEQVLLNILVNGCDAIGQAGTNSGRITVAVEIQPDAVEIVIEDNGPGISDEVRASLFDPFVTTKVDGMGMGLAISRSIVEDHGGRIWASESSTGGTRFHVSLPVQ